MVAFDTETMGAINPEVFQCRALIFLYSLSAQTKTSPEKSCPSASPFFIKQTIENACGTIALLHSLANNEPLCEPGSFVDALRMATTSVSAFERGKLLECDEELCALHAGFSQQGQTEAPEASADVDLHFVAFIESNGCLFEMDGRLDAPICHGKVEESFFASCCAAIQAKYLSASEVSTITATALVPASSYID